MLQNVWYTLKNIVISRWLRNKVLLYRLWIVMITYIVVCDFWLNSVYRCLKVNTQHTTFLVKLVQVIFIIVRHICFRKQETGVICMVLGLLLYGSTKYIIHIKDIVKTEKYNRIEYIIMCKKINYIMSYLSTRSNI